MSRILLVVTGADSLALADGRTHPTGFWAEELVVAHRDLTSAGHVVEIATPSGVRPTVDPGSLSAALLGDQARVDEYTSYLASIEKEFERPLAFNEVHLVDYAAIVLPGGHGPMVDLATDATLGRILTVANANGILIAPFCHGPAGLLSAVDEDGVFAFAGRRLTVFSDEEEETGGLGENAPWLVASTLAARGAIVEDGPAWSSHVVRDRNLITGQNPQSSGAVIAELLAALAG